MDGVSRSLRGRINGNGNNRLVAVESRLQVAAIGVLVCADLLALVTSIAIVRWYFGQPSDFSRILLLIGAFSYGLGVALLELYPGRGMLGPTRIRLRALMVLVGFISPAVVGLLLQFPQFGQAATDCVSVGVLLFLFGAFFELVAIHLADVLGFWRSQAVYVGDPKLSARIKSDLEIYPELGLELVDHNDGAWPSTLMQLDTFEHRDTRQAVDAHGTDAFVTDTASPLPAYYPAGRRSAGRHRGGKEVVAIALKRMIDIAGAAVALVFLSPVLLATILGVYLADGRPVFFCQERGGKGEKKICVWKIRSMYRDAQVRLDSVLTADPAAQKEWDRFFKLSNDPRVLPGIGTFIRTTSIDELPQFWNVLNGEMSLVGPRPFPQNHLDVFSAEFRALRARVVPGISGLWQVTLRSNGDIDAQERLDRAYVEGWSLWLDLYILFRTPIAMLTSHGAK